MNTSLKSLLAAGLHDFALKMQFMLSPWRMSTAKSAVSPIATIRGFVCMVPYVSPEPGTLLSVLF